MEAASSFFDKSIFSLQNVATKLYPMGGQWMFTKQFTKEYEIRRE